MVDLYAFDEAGVPVEVRTRYVSDTREAAVRRAYQLLLDQQLGAVVHPSLPTAECPSPVPGRVVLPVD